VPSVVNWKNSMMMMSASMAPPIALAEGKIALEVMLDRLRNPRFAPGHEIELENIDNFQKRVPKKLYIEFDPG